METTKLKRPIVLNSEGSVFLSENNYCCRCCLAAGPSVACEQLLKGRNLLHYTSCTKISIDAEDGLSKYVCKKCCKLLANFYKFQIMCKMSHETLHNAIEASIRDNTSIKHEVDSAYFDNLDSCPKKNKNNGIQLPNEEWDSDDERSISMIDPLDGKWQGKKYEKCKLLNSDERNHIETKAIKKKYTASLTNCQICNAEIRKSLLKRHMEIHDLEKPLHHCEVCKKSFKSTIHFERHNKSNFIICQICGKSIFNKTYEIHIKRHNKQKDYTCETCGQKFYQRSLLKHHKLDRHMGRKYTCDYCKKEFITKFAIRTHIYRHSETPRFKCDVCEKAYRSHWILTLHKRTHTGVEPYKCGMCQRGFTNLSKMKRHKISHTEERGFVCEHCNYAYKYKSSYRRHLERCKKRKDKIGAGVAIM